MPTRGEIVTMMALFGAMTVVGWMNYLQTWFGVADGHRCDAAAKTIQQCGLEHRAASSRRRILGLGISYRETATAVLRRWLNRAATERLTGRNRSEVSGAEDKWIRRRDIADYERMLRTKVLV